MNRSNSISPFLILTLLLFGNASSLAQTQPVAPAEKSFEISRAAQELMFIPNRLQTIDRKLSTAVRSEKIAGCSVLIMKDDQEVCFGTWGKRNREKDLPIKRDTIFRIYSMTKPITSIAVMQLVEAGKIDLDAPVSEYLPEFMDLQVLETKPDGEEVKVAPRRAMTTRDLLRHTSGLTYGFFGDSSVDKLYRKNGILILENEIKQTVQKLGTIPLLNHPGSKFVYSVSADVLGRLVEVVSGQAFDVYLQEKIFTPLDMHDTFFSVPFEKLDRLAQLYAPDRPNGIKPANGSESLRFISSINSFFSGGGGLCSTLDDYANFCRMLNSEGKFKDQQIVNAKTLKEMFTNQLANIDQPPGQFKFGLGFAISDRDDYSWSGAAGTGFWVNPAKKLTVIYMVQIMPNGDRNYRDDVREAAYAAMK